jgi:hypothetical protein
MFLGITKVWGGDNLVSLWSDKGILKRHASELLDYCEVSILIGTLAAGSGNEEARVPTQEGAGRT